MEAGNSMVRQMQIVFPIVARIQSEVISRYGFPCNGPGSVQFIQVGRDYTWIFKKRWLMVLFSFDYRTASITLQRIRRWLDSSPSQRNILYLQCITSAVRKCERHTDS